MALDLQNLGLWAHGMCLYYSKFLCVGLNTGDESICLSDVI